MSLTPAMAVAKRQLRFERKSGEWTVNGVTWDDVEATGFTLLFANPSRSASSSGRWSTSQAAGSTRSTST